MTESDRTSPVLHGWEGRRENALQTHRCGYRWAVRAGMAGSLVVHAVLILFVARQLHLTTQPFELLAPRARPAEGLQVVELRQGETEPQETLVELPWREEERTPTERVAERARQVPVRGREDAGGYANAEKLKPREGDGRVWKGSGGEPLPYYVGDAYAPGTEAVRVGLSLMLESLEFLEKQRRRNVGWRFGEGDAEAGLTIEGPVIGEQSILLKPGTFFTYEGPYGREVRQGERALAEIQRSDILMDVEAAQRERVERMRRHTKAEGRRSTIG